MKRVIVALLLGASSSIVACDSQSNLDPVIPPPTAMREGEGIQVPMPNYEPAPEGTLPYTVVVKNEVTDYANVRNDLLTSEAGAFQYQFKRFGEKRAFIASFTPEAAERIAQDPRVDWMVADTPFVVFESTRTVSDLWDWGLDRIDQRSGLDDTYTYYADGSGVHIFVLDTGVDTTHSQFTGRVGTGYSVPAIQPASPYEDDWGHGTKVASVAAGATYGVANGATIHPIRVTLNDTVDQGRLQTAIDEAVDMALSNNWMPAVINISAGTDNSGTATKINDAFDDGILVFKSSGNKNEDAYNDSGDRARGSLVVGATTVDDERWVINDTVGSDWGSTVDLMAPGEVIVVAEAGGDSVPATGTSIAAPFAAGVAALVLENNPDMDPGTLKDVLVETASANHLASETLNGSPNLLLYSIHFWIEEDWTGPTWIAEEDEYLYEMADAVGGTLSYTYEWWCSTDGQNFTLAYTGQDYNRTIEWDDPDFWLKVKVSSGSYYPLSTWSQKIELCWNHDEGENCDWKSGPRS